MTPEQHLKRIFLKLDAVEKLKEPQRTEQLRKMIRVALRDLERVEMPEAEQPNDQAHAPASKDYEEPKP